jgi:hypothetical protein
MCFQPSYFAFFGGEYSKGYEIPIIQYFRYSKGYEMPTIQYLSEFFGLD